MTGTLQAIVERLTPEERCGFIKLLMADLNEEHLIWVLAQIRHLITVIETARDMAD